MKKAAFWQPSLFYWFNFISVSGASEQLFVYGYGSRFVYAGRRNRVVRLQCRGAGVVYVLQQQRMHATAVAIASADADEWKFAAGRVLRAYAAVL